MNTPATALRYLLSTTVLTVQAALRLAVVADDAGGHLEPEVVVTLTSPTRPLPAVSAGRVPVAPDAAGWAVPGSLRRTFDAAHPRTAALAADLSARAEQFLAGLRMGEEPHEVIAIGQALEVVHRELAGADRMRRGWIAGQSRDVHASTWDLCQDDLVPTAGAPRTLPADLALPTEAATTLAAEYGVLVAWVEAGGASTIAVYRRPPVELPDGATAAGDLLWHRDDELSHLHVVDASPAAASAGGAMPATAQHTPLGLGSPSGLTGVPLPRSADDAWSPAESGQASHRTGAVRVAVEAARCQLELLQGSDEYTRLSATHARAAELEELEHEARLVGGLSRRA